MKDLLGYKDEFLSTKKWYNFLRFFSPLPCMICGEIDFSSNGPFCAECYKRFEELLKSPCKICGEPKEKCLCDELKGIKKLFFLLWYDSRNEKQLIYKAKYRGEIRYATYFGKLIAECLQNRLTDLKSSNKSKSFAICFVPRSVVNKNKRGFDQSLFLAQSVSHYLGLPILHCIKRKGKSDEQKKLSGEQRSRNVKNKFYVDTKELLLSNGKKPSEVILIDDVVTTGSTVKECSFLLRQAGIRQVVVGAIAKTPAKRIKKDKKRYIKKQTSIYKVSKRLN